jgi:hypothetical protein
MKKTILIAAALLSSGAALASSHREAPAIAADPAADNTDVYAFVTTKATANDTLNIVANWIPFEEPSGGPNFFKWSDDVQYKIHIHEGNGPITDSVVYTFRFTTQKVPHTLASATCASPGTAACVGGGKEFFSQITGDASTTGGAIVQTYTITKTVNGVDTVISTNTSNGPLVSAIENIGPMTQATLHALAPGLVTSATYDDAYAATFNSTLSDGSVVFAGPRDDGFYVDLGGIFDLANLRAKAGVADCTLRGGQCTKAQDGLAGFNVHSIAIQIPTKSLTFDGNAPAVGAPSDKNTVGIWASSSRQKVTIQRADGSTSAYGPWVQVSRLGIPLINEAVIGYQDKDKYNRTYPANDVTNFGAYILNPVIVPDAEAVGIYHALGVTVTDALRHNRTDIIDIIDLAATGCTTYPTTKCHTVALGDGSTGDVLRVDLNLDPAKYGFPNGRSLINAANPNAEAADVTDVELSLLLGGIGALSANGDTGHPPFIQDHVDYNDKAFPQKFPWLALPWQGYSEGHGKTTP